VTSPPPYVPPAPSEGRADPPDSAKSPSGLGAVLRGAREATGRAVRGLGLYRRAVVSRSLRRNAGRPRRRLEIGPGGSRLEGFETLDVLPGRHVDYPVDGAGRLPFEDHTFVLVYASHVLEHIPWYQTVEVLREWARILAPGGALEVWVPDGLKICRTLVGYEDGKGDETARDGWYRFNPDRDPCRWAAGRIFTYGDGTGRTDHPNWHRALFTPRYLERCFREAGLDQVRPLDRSEVRGYDHGWINLGMAGRKP
jgi:SAM-dependent methyltransferase